MSECIEWKGWKDRFGYGERHLNGKRQFAHRVAYCQHKGVPIESIKGLIVRHTCDNPGCVNPNHLLLGTHDDNMRDKTARRRAPYGENNRRAKLTESQVKEIRDVYVFRHSQFGAVALAERFGVSTTTIRDVINNKRWTHLLDNHAEPK